MRENKDEEQEPAEPEKEPQNKADQDPTGPGGADDDDPEDLAIKHTTKLDKDFETLLRNIFKAKNDHHEVFEAWHHHSM